jgi:L-amino acid N-acyltransferase YncA
MRSLQTVLSATTYKGFPVVTSKEDMAVVGYLYIYIYIYIHAYIHTYIHTYVYTYIHT